MTDPRFAWIHLLAAIVLGLSMGWNIALHVWNHQAKKARPKPDPLSLEARFKRAVLEGKPIVLTGHYEIQALNTDRYREIAFERVEEDE